MRNDDKRSSADAGKRAAALAAVEYVQDNSYLGIGTGSTVDLFIEALVASKIPLAGAVSSSENTSRQLKAAGIDVLDLNATGDLDLYIDGADEVDPRFNLIKGGGAALTREKIVAAASATFICLVDQRKPVEVLGDFGLPIEVIPMARSYVARQIVKLGADPEYREGPVTDNGNVILDCYNFRIEDPVALEAQINGIAGVVTCGLFAARGADRLVVGFDDGRVEVTESPRAG